MDTNKKIEIVSRNTVASKEGRREKEYYKRKSILETEKIKSNKLIAKAIVFSSLLIAGVLLYFIVSFYEVNWYFPSFGYLVFCFLGYNIFLRS